VFVDEFRKILREWESERRHDNGATRHQWCEDIANQPMSKMVLFCMALGIVVASAIFAPIPVGEGINTDTWFVGP